METVSSLLFIAVLVIIANFLVRLVRPKFSKRQHILWSILSPAIALWILVMGVLVLSQASDESDLMLVAFVTAAVFPVISVGLELPITFVILKFTGWFK